MPSYTYRCQTCRSRFEANHGINDPPLTDCPAFDCGEKGSLERLIVAGAGVTFKGSGWTPKFHGRK